MSVSQLVGEQAPVRRLLVVDDDKAVLFAMCSFFSEKGYNVDCASEQAEAEALIARHRYGVVIADLNLGWLEERGGLEILDRVQARWEETGVVLLTAYGSRKLEREALRRGASAFLCKPVRLGELEELVGSLLQSKRPNCGQPLHAEPQ